MANIKLITDVSKIGLLQSLARTRRRLVVSTILAVAATYGLGFWSAHYILETSTSVVANMFIITGDMFLVLIASFLATVLIGDLTFAGPWRETVFLGDRSDAEDAPVSNHNGEFLVILLLLIIGNAFALNFATGNFLERYHTVGYFQVRLRAEAPDQRVAALETLTRDHNFQIWEQSDVQQLVVDSLDDPAPKVRAMAAWSAGKMENLEAREKLKQLVETDDSPRVIADAAVALGKLGLDAEARRSIEERMTSSEDETLVVGTLRGLGLMGSSRSIDKIVPLLDSDNEPIMVHAYWALRQIGSEEVRDTIRQRANSTDSSIERCAAFDTLKKVATEEDVLWARRQYQTGDFEDECKKRVWRERDDTPHYILIGDSYREKLIKIVANEAAREHRDWFQRIINDPNEPYRLREVANAVLRQLREAEQ